MSSEKSKNENSTPISLISNISPDFYHPSEESEEIEPKPKIVFEDVEVVEDVEDVEKGKEEEKEKEKENESQELISIDKTISVNDAINEYYKLKSKYETDYYNKYIKPIVTSKKKSKHIKRLDYQRLPRAECINCKRNVGSIFIIKKNADELFRQFIAKCGDLDEPCPLNINIEYSERNKLSLELDNVYNQINDAKNKIIMEKNNMMFGYINQKKAIETFNVDTTVLV